MLSIQAKGLCVKNVTKGDRSMSNKENDNFNETIKELVEEYWTIKDRPDLFEDCVEYVLDEKMKGVSRESKSVSWLMLEYFQSIAHNAISNEDLNNMERQHHN